MQQDHLTKSFGLIIAFIVPGMVGLYAATFPVPELREWFGIASSQPPTVSGFLFVNVAAAGAGVFLSGFRWQIIECWLWGEKNPGDEVSVAERHRSEPAYQNLVAQLYDFYLFYANTLVALVALYLAWAITEWTTVGLSWGLLWPLLVLVPVGYVLERSARNAYDRFHKRRRSLLKGVA